MTSYIKQTIEDRVSHIYLDRGKSNAIHMEMLEQLGAAIDEAQRNPSIEGLIIYGKDGFFSSGLDLITLYEYNEEQARQFWQKFFDVIRALVAFDKPAVAAITGHSPAGGCVLSICCDYRIMAQGEYIIGLNEVPVGLIVPHSIFRLYAFWLGEAKAYRYLLEGKLMNPEDALRSGLVDELVDPRKIRTTAERQLKQYRQYEQQTWRRSKTNLRKDLISVLTSSQEETLEALVKQWWQPSTRSIVKTIIDNLKANKPA